MRRRLNAAARRALVEFVTGKREDILASHAGFRALMDARCLAFTRSHVSDVGAYAAFTLTPRGRARALTLVEGSPERERTLRPRKLRTARRDDGPHFAEYLLSRMRRHRRETEALLTGGPFKPARRPEGFAPAGHTTRMLLRACATTGRDSDAAKALRRAFTRIDVARIATRLVAP
jgi:hypothetical protein